LKKTLFIFFLLPGFVSGQKLNLSRPVFWWSVFHPAAAVKAKKVSRETLHICDSLYKDSVTLGQQYAGGQLDAFRHVLWMCRLTEKLGATKAYSLGVKYEKGNRRQFEKNKKEDAVLPDSMSTVMDLVNNQIGVEIGYKLLSSHTKLSRAELIHSLVTRTKAGEFRILLQDKKGNFYTCEGKQIDPGKYTGQWGIPKCLVKSNVIHP
jgi:hypothetical protein